MDYSWNFVMGRMENSYLDFNGLELTNEQLIECLKIYNPRLERTMIEHLELTNNNVNHFDINEILRTFPYLQSIHVSNVDAIDNLTSQQVSIRVV